MILIRRFLSIVLALATLASASRASFQEMPSSVRASSMGNAAVALTAEPPALFSNPAGLSKLNRPELSFAYGQAYAGLTDTTLGIGSLSLAYPLGYGTLGVGVGQFLAAGLKEERTASLGYGMMLLRKVHLGAAAKQLYHRYDAGSSAGAGRDPIFKNGLERSAYAVDLGLQVSLNRWVKVGAAGRNLNQPNVGLATEDRVRRTIQAGLVLSLPEMGLRAAGDVARRAPSVSAPVKARTLGSLGLEKDLTRDVVLRFGVNSTEYTAGMGLRLNRVGFDYALVMNRSLLQDNAGTHRVGLTYQFGQDGRRTRIFTDGRRVVQQTEKLR